MAKGKKKKANAAQKRKTAVTEKKQEAVALEAKAEVPVAVEPTAPVELAQAPAVEAPKVEKEAPRKAAAPKKATKAEKQAKVDAPKERKKPGPKPKTAAQKAEDLKKRAELKKAAAAMKPEFILQYQGAEVSVEELAAKAEAAFKAEHKRTLIMWIIYAVYLHLRLRAKHSGVKMAWYAIIAVPVVLFTFAGVNTLMPGLHSYG